MFLGLVRPWALRELPGKTISGSLEDEVRFLGFLGTSVYRRWTQWLLHRGQVAPPHPPGPGQVSPTRPRLGESLVRTPWERREVMLLTRVWRPRKALGETWGDAGLRRSLLYAMNPQ
jgi:hypothetical protein